MRLTALRFWLVTFYFACAASLAVIVRFRWGWPGLAAAFPLGICLGACIVEVLWRLLVFLRPWPQCRRGNCRQSTDYLYPEGSLYGYDEEAQAWRLKCRCGDQYLFDGKRFMELTKDNRRLPYKRLVGLRKWTDDET